ncbi:hypothetical protein [Thermus islandicus]|uniref:hypothetical protein n=1 Tax=Thermus islandicus TaxID=540988 RepID=UPI0003B3BC1D|nr:hypothetical protein [Thermus islandicus]
MQDVRFGGTGAWVLAGLWAFLVSKLHREGVREKKAALEIFSFNPLSALRFLGALCSTAVKSEASPKALDRPLRVC